jgi:diadenosine tetraphosphate (Ap4A) HIT family hydrolase
MLRRSTGSVVAECFNCQRIRLIRSGENPNFVTELQTCYVVLGDFHAWRGYTLLLAKRCAAELHELTPVDRHAFLEELALVAHAVWNVFRPAKLNYEMLGNAVPHLHWHIFPRYADDPDRLRPVWFRYSDAMDDPKYQLSPDERDYMRQTLAGEILRLRDARNAG